MIYLCEQKFEHSFEWKGMILNCIREYKCHIIATFLSFHMMVTRDRNVLTI